MITLLLNTSQPTAVVMLLRDNDILARQEWTADRHLGKVLLEVIEVLLERYHIKSADLDRIAVHGGPGHFGALRAGITVASSLAVAWKKDLVQLSKIAEADLIQEALGAKPRAVVLPLYK